METIKKTLVVFGAVIIAMLMVSSATAVPQVQSKPVMDKVEQMEQSNGLQINQKTLNKLVSGDLNEDDLQVIVNNLDLNGFVSYFTSMEFANFFNSADIQNSLNSQNYNIIYNSDPIQTILNSNQFDAFMNTDIAQQFLANINGDGGNSNQQSQGTSSVVGSQINTLVGQNIALPSNNVVAGQTPINNIVVGQNVAQGGTMTISGQSMQMNVVQQHTNSFNLFAGLFIGLFSWENGGPQPQCIMLLLILIYAWATLLSGIMDFVYGMIAIILFLIQW